MAEAKVEVLALSDPLVSHEEAGKVDGQNQTEVSDDIETRTFVRLLMRAHAFEESSERTEHPYHEQNIPSKPAITGSIEDEPGAAATVDRPLVPDNMPSPHQELEGRDASMNLKTADDRKPHTSMVQQIAPRALLLFVCFAYLAISAMTIDIGLSAISKHLERRVEKAEVQLKAAMDDRYREKVLYHRLDTIISTPLNRGFMETYEECLVRGLQTANSQMSVSGWTDYADIRNQTIEWTTQNCGRLLYTPQIMEPSAQHVISVYLVSVCRHSHQVVVRTLEFIKQRTRLVLNWWYGQGYIDVAAVEEKGNSSVQDTRRPHTKIPFGFDLQCDASLPCRLMYPPSHCSGRVETVGNTVSQANNDQCFDKKRTSEKTTAQARRRAANLAFFHMKIREAMEKNTRLLSILIQCEFICAMTYLLAATRTLCKRSQAPIRKTPLLNIHQAFHQASKEAKYALGTITIQLCALSSYKVVDRLSRNDKSHLSCLIGLSLTACGIAQLLNFFFPIKQVEHIFQPTSVAKDLYRILRRRDLSQQSETDLELEPAEQENISKMLLLLLPILPLLPLSVTTVHHDFCQTTYPSAEYSPASVSDSIIATYTDSDTDGQYARGYDTDDDDDDDDGVGSESFIDLAGGVTPVVLEASSGWSVVDA